MLEEWKPVVGYEGLYSVSNLGRVRSEERLVAMRGGYKVWREKILNPYCAKGTRYMITLVKDGSKRNILLHRLVAEAFLPNPKNKPEVNHIDNNPLNNKLDNLEWCTRKENMEHCAKQGRTRKYVTPDRLKEATALLEQGVSRNEIGRRLKMSDHTIRKLFGKIEPCKT